MKPGNAVQPLVEAMAHINAAVANCRLYAQDHPQVARHLDVAHKALLSLLSARPDVTFLIVDDEVVVDARPLSAQYPQSGQFAQILNGKAIERLTFTREVTRDELFALIRDLANPDLDVISSSRGIRLGKVRVGAFPPSVKELRPDIMDKLNGLGLLGNRPWDDVAALFDGIKSGSKSPLKELDVVIQRFLQGMRLNVNPLDLLAALKTSDEYTYTHAVNVCLLTMAQAELLGIQGRKLYEIGVAAAMHDAGKMFIPEEVLNKPGKLTHEEWVLMRHHTIRGARYILRVEGLPRLAFLGALEHHIRYDGSGYPALQKGWYPNIVSQMIAVADIFDAMRSRRPYQPPKPDRLIIGILVEESGTSFNPYLVQNFLRIVGEDNQPISKEP